MMRFPRIGGSATSSKSKQRPKGRRALWQAARGVEMLEQRTLLSTVEFTVASQAYTEDVGTITVTAHLSEPIGLAVNVPFVITGTATAGNDFSISSSPFHFNAGEQDATVTIGVVNDLLDELDETIVITMGNPNRPEVTLGAIAQQTVTILNDDAPLTVEFIGAGQSVSEADGTVTILAQLSKAAAGNVTVPFTVTGTAADGTDYTITPSPVTIAAGTLSASITVSLADDLLDEVDETVIVTMGAPSSGAIQGPTAVHTVTITDNDASPTVTFTAGSLSVAEDGAAFTITAQLEFASGANVTIPLDLAGTATPGTDYTLSAAQIVIPAGSLDGSVIVTLTDDGLYELSETAVVSMGALVNALPGATTTFTATIADNDTKPTVVIDPVVLPNVGENGTTNLTVTLSGPAGVDVSIPVTLGGTATEGEDYTTNLVNGMLVIPAGQTTGTLTITLIPDNMDEPDEDIIVTIGTPDNADPGGTTTQTITIVDDDPPPTVDFVTATQSTKESIGTFTMTVQLSTPSAFEISVPFTVSGTAADGTDFTIVASPITIPALSPTGTITVTVLEDAEIEPDETITVSLGAPVNATLGATTIHTATVLDNDPTPTVSFAAAAQTVAEDGAAFTITAQLSDVSKVDVVIPLDLSGNAALGADYTLSGPPVLVIPAGTLSASIDLTPTEDAIYEGSEMAFISMGSLADALPGATTTFIATITDNDARPTAEFGQLTQGVDESGGVTTITVQLTAAAGVDVAVPFTLGGTAAAGTDYTINVSPLIIPAGATSAALTITLMDDGMDEPDETIIVTMGAPDNADVGATAVQTQMILDNDLGPTVAFAATSQSVVEAAGTVTLTVQLAAASGFDVSVPFTVSGTALAGIDYTIDASPLVIPAGALSGQITINIINDLAIEPNESIVVAMGVPGNATAAAPGVFTTTILKNNALTRTYLIKNAKRLPLRNNRTTPVSFGAVLQNSTGAVRTFRVFNRGTEILNLGKLRVPAGWTLVEGLTNRLLPGRSDSFRVKLATTTAGKKAGTLVFNRSDDRRTPFKIKVAGEVKAAAPAPVPTPTPGVFGLTRLTGLKYWD